MCVGGTEEARGDRQERKRHEKQQTVLLPLQEAANHCARGLDLRDQFLHVPKFNAVWGGLEGPRTCEAKHQTSLSFQLSPRFVSKRKKRTHFKLFKAHSRALV